MKQCLLIQVALLIMINVVFGAVGDGSVSNGLSSLQSDQGYLTGAESGALPSYSSNSATTAQVSLPAGSPTSLDINTESLVLPDYNLYKPSTGQMTQSGYSGYPVQGSYSGYATQGSYPGYDTQGGNSGYPAQAGYSASYTTYAGSTAFTGAVSGSYPCQGSYPASSSLTTPYGYVPQSYQAVYPIPSTCRCNEYYVQLYPGRLNTVAGVYCGNWLPLWSKVSRPGVYWSYEWTVCGNPRYYCSPQVKNFGCKNTGWFQTWFMGDTPGWHILSYYCNDWSNYIYIYVWPVR
ncbi:Uncharacterised protein [uncultured archaeon]|nr:Uncharacterised protein [uncultured archaeon]